MTVVPYYTLPPAYLTGIVELKLGRLAQRLASANRIVLDFAPEVSETIAARCTEVDSGARNIDFILGKSLTPALSDAVLSAMAQGRSLKKLRVSTDSDGTWNIEPEFDAAEEPIAPATGAQIGRASVRAKEGTDG